LVPSGSALVGKPLSESGLLDSRLAKLLAVRRNDGTLFVDPENDVQIEEGDLLVALGSETQLTATAAQVQ